MHPLGYDHPEPQRLSYGTPAKSMNDPSLRLTSDEMAALENLVENEQLTSQLAGRKGVFKLAQDLPYMDRVNFFTVPAAHVLLYGVARSFWNVLLAKVNACTPPSHARKADCHTYDCLQIVKLLHQGATRTLLNTMGLDAQTTLASVGIET